MSHPDVLRGSSHVPLSGAGTHDNPLIGAPLSWAGTRDESLRMSAWEASNERVCGKDNFVTFFGFFGIFRFSCL